MRSTNGVSVRPKVGARCAAALLASAAGVMGLSVFPAVVASPSRVDLRVLVVADGTPWDDAIRQQLSSEGVPTTVVNLSDTARPAITKAYLAGTLADGTPHAKFQGVVLPNDGPAGLSAAEKSALESFEQTFSVREVDGYVYPNARVGLNPLVYAGSLDGDTARATTSAKADVFRYLNGPMPFEPKDPTFSKSYGYLTTPLPDDPTTGAHFEPYLTAPIPGTLTPQYTLAGVYRKSGREQLVINFAYDYNQPHYHVMAHGIVDWVTRGVHLGYWRNYFSMHIDDVFNKNWQWSDMGKCTPGEGDCRAGSLPPTPIRMIPDDVTNAVSWEQQNNYKLDFLLNGAGSDQAPQPDALTTALLANKGHFWWLNHTYSHQFLGCVQDFTVIPWRCQTDTSGNIVWVSQQAINSEIQKNLAWASAHGLPLRTNELVGGKHSGALTLPQQPVDNPNFVAAVTQKRISWLGLDASREPGLRQVASAQGVPRHPLNVFYDVAKASDEVSEYNWMYTSKANGGSGTCEANPAKTTCITPLNPVTGWRDYILPLETQITLRYVLSNDPRPFYVHQSNLTQDRLALRAVSSVLAVYRTAFADNTPVVNQTLTDSGTALWRQSAWQQTQNAGTITGYVQGGVVTVQGPAGTKVPITAPAGTRVVGGGTFGGDYAGEQSAYTTLGSSPATLTLPTPAFTGASK
jgi:hypothetical protein